MDCRSLNSIQNRQESSLLKLVLLLFLILIPSGTLQAQWEKLYQSYTYGFSDIYFLDNDFGFFIYGGYEHFFKTTDGFDSYEVIRIPDTYILEDIIFFDTLRGYAIGYYNNLYKTEDGGYNWKRITLDYEYPVLFTQFHKQGQDTLYLAGNKLIRTTDGGKKWEEIRDYLPFVEDENFVTLDFRKGTDSLLITSQNVFIPVSTDSGRSYKKAVIPDFDENITHTSFIDAYIYKQKVFLITTSRVTYSYLYKSDDYGNTWKKIELPEDRYHSVNGLNEDTVFVTSDAGTFIQSYDGLNTWDEIKLDTDRRVNEIIFTEDRTGYLISDRGIYKNEQFKLSTSTKPEDPDVGKSIRLHQNYPNPFNPTTNIEFTLSKPTQVELSVYDLLGRKIDIIFTGRRSSGSHSYTFNASHLSSGIYFYELKADNFVERKMMTLVK